MQKLLFCIDLETVNFGLHMYTFLNMNEAFNNSIFTPLKLK